MDVLGAVLSDGVSFFYLNLIFFFFNLTFTSGGLLTRTEDLGFFYREQKPYHCKLGKINIKGFCSRKY